MILINTTQNNTLHKEYGFCSLNEKKFIIGTLDDHDIFEKKYIIKIYVTSPIEKMLFYGSGLDVEVLQ